ncbi:MAG: hypothetical protein K0B01_09160 [Syntrophobacterales bacterium]|nr:hypothetical protein [Syntrophobacterales bacterium]
MEKRPEIKDDRVKQLEILNPVKRNSPFLSFRYSYREVSSVGGNTYVKAKEKKFENSKFTSEEFEGVAPGNHLAAEMQQMFFGQIASLVKAFTAFLPGVKRDKRG